MRHIAGEVYCALASLWIRIFETLEWLPVSEKLDREKLFTGKLEK